MALDQFYTKPEVAQRCWATISHLNPSLWVEPSAGTGSFFKLLPEPRFGIDLDPKFEGIVQGNWLLVIERKVLLNFLIMVHLMLLIYVS